MNISADALLYAGAVVLVVFALRMAGVFSRQNRTTELNARTQREARRVKGKGSAKSDSPLAD